MDYQQQYQFDHSFLPAISPPSMPPWQQQQQLQPSSPFRNIPQQQNNPNTNANRVHQSIRFDAFPQNAASISQNNRFSNPFPVQMQQNSPIRTKISMSPQSLQQQQQQQYQLSNEQSSLRSPIMNRIPYENNINSPYKYYNSQDIQQYPSAGSSSSFSSPSQQYQQPLVSSPFKVPITSNNAGYVNISQVLNSNDWVSPVNRRRRNDNKYPFLQSVQYASQGIEDSISYNKSIQQSPIATEHISSRRSYQRSSSQNNSQNNHNNRSIDEGYFKEKKKDGIFYGNAPRNSIKDGRSIIITQSAQRNKNNNNRDSYQNQQAYLESYIGDDDEDDNNREDQNDHSRKYQQQQQQYFYENQPNGYRKHKPLKQLNNDFDYDTMKEYIDSNAEQYSNYTSSNRNRNNRSSFSSNNRFVLPNGRRIRSNNSTQKKQDSNNNNTNHKQQSSMVNEDVIEERLARRASICLQELEQIERENKAKAIQEYSKQLEEQIEQDKQKRREEKRKRDIEELMYEQAFQRSYQHEKIDTSASRQTKRYTSVSDDRAIKAMNEGERNQLIEEDLLLVSGDNQEILKKKKDKEDDGDGGGQGGKKEDKKIGKNSRKGSNINDKGKERILQQGKERKEKKKEGKEMKKEGKEKEEIGDEGDGQKQKGIEDRRKSVKQDVMKDKGEEEGKDNKDKGEEENKKSQNEEKDRKISSSLVESNQDQNNQGELPEKISNQNELEEVKEDINIHQEHHQETLLTLQVVDQEEDILHKTASAKNTKEAKIQMNQQDSGQIEGEKKINNDNNEDIKNTVQIDRKQESARKKSNELNEDETQKNNDRLNQQKDGSEISKESEIVSNIKEPQQQPNQSDKLSLEQNLNPRQYQESKIEHSSNQQLKRRIHRKNRSTDKRVIMTKLSQLGRYQQKLEQTVQEIQNLTEINNQNSRKQLFLLESAISRLSNSSNQ